MEYMQAPATSSQGNILCCTCGVPIPPNPANMCVSCLRTQVDISDGIPKQVTVHFCKQCERYLQPPGTWVQCALESRELLALCLKKLKSAMTKVRLIDAGFLWTEPHSKRIKLKLTIQKEVMNGAILQQVFVVEFVIQPQMCDDCHRVEAKDFWKAVVQVRQKTVHKKTFYYLEQLILKHKVHQNTLRIKEIHEGIDFYYGSKQHAQKMVDFLQCTVPCRSKTSQRLISHDVHSNTYNYKSTFSVEIVPICKDNVVCLSPRLAQSLGNMGQVCVCIQVTSTVHLIDPNTLQPSIVPDSWRSLSSWISNIIKDQRLGAGAGLRSNRSFWGYEPHLGPSVAWVWGELGVGGREKWTSEMDTSQQYHCRTFLGHLLNIGDLVLGYDFANSNINDEFLNKMNPHHIPDVVRAASNPSHDPHNEIIILLFVSDVLLPPSDVLLYPVSAASGTDKKSYEGKSSDLDRVPHEADHPGLATRSSYHTLADRDMVNQDKQIMRTRASTQFGKTENASKIPVESDTDEEGAPRVSLAEMLEDLSLNDATGGEGADMMTE
ncbi:hypothetical protein NFI96_021752 [Prochilodus magdalenae]|nr:hypothetical protein NFI96_021752 [Prochilodus magdalenae]